MDTKFCDALKKEYIVGLVPGSFFYSGLTDVNNNLVRLALSKPTKDIIEGIKKINEFINKL